MNPNLKRALAGIVLVLATTAPVFPQWWEDGKKVPDKPWSKSEGDLSVMLVLTEKPNEFCAAWDKGIPHVKVSDNAVARPGLPLVGLVMFTRCAQDAAGHCDAGVKFTVLQPDAGACGSPKVRRLWVGKPSPSRGTLELGEGNILVVIEPGDPSGLYATRAEVEDRVSGKRLMLERTFETIAADPRKQGRDGVALLLPRRSIQLLRRGSRRA